MKLSKFTRIAILCFLVMVATAFFYYVKEKAKEDAIELFYVQSSKRLEVIDEYIDMFFDLYKEHIVELSSVPELLIAEKDFPLYRDRQGEHTWTYETLSAPGKKVVQTWRDLVIKDADIVDVYAGFESESSISYEAYEFPVGFLGAERPWYREAKESDNDVNIGHAYLSISGKTVTPLTHKLYNQRDEFIGVVGLDISLEGIINYIQAMNFDKTGFFVLLEQGGLVLCNSRHLDYNFRHIHELPDLAWEEIFITDKEKYRLKFNDEKNYLVSSYISNSGYRILAIMSEEEIIANSPIEKKNIFLLGILVLILLYGAYSCFRFRKTHKQQDLQI